MDVELFPVEIIMADTHTLTWLCLKISAGTTIEEAIMLAGLVVDDNAAVGIWGAIKTRDCPVASGDRIEIYRPLLADPMVMRQKRALQEMRDFKQQRQLKKQRRFEQYRETEPAP